MMSAEFPLEDQTQQHTEGLFSEHILRPTLLDGYNRTFFDRESISIERKITEEYCLIYRSFLVGDRVEASFLLDSLFRPV
jgi:hypothetical protein